ncbi:IMP dehydrogenase [Anaplasmataceae bacterium AB001_6]|nr:IMP dehydrogenase [Anaplasmataceae bacterium AB001_6]
MNNPTDEKYTFDDILLLPQKSDILPSEANVKTYITKKIQLNIPIISAAMDTVTDYQMAIAMAKYGGMGCIHRNMPTEEQCFMIEKVKKYESWVIMDPVTINVNKSVQKLFELKEKYNYSGIPIVDDKNILKGIITNRDLKCVTDKNAKVADIMTKEVITVKANVNKKEALSILYKNKIERLVVIDDSFRCIGLITVKDIENFNKYPDACKDKQGRLRVAAAIGPKDFDRVKMLIDAGADLLILDTAHGHSVHVLKMVEKIKSAYNTELVAGNIVTKEAANDLINCGVDAVKVGIGPGSICTTRVIAGVGMPQLSAISEVSEVCHAKNIKVIADGGMRYSGDIAKAISFGADLVMLGSMLAGTSESPGDTILYKGRSYKSYRGMGSLPAMKAGSSSRYFKSESDTDGINDSKKMMIPEGVEAMVPFKGCLKDTIDQIVGGIKTSMGYTGSKDISYMQKNCKFIKITGSSMRENHPHGVKITRESANYSE